MQEGGEGGRKEEEGGSEGEREGEKGGREGEEVEEREEKDETEGRETRTGKEEKRNRNKGEEEGREGEEEGKEGEQDDQAKPFHRRCCAGCHTPSQCPDSVVPLYWETHPPHCSEQMLPQSPPTKRKNIRTANH